MTPSARDWKDTPGMATTAINPDGSERSRIDMLARQVTDWENKQTMEISSPNSSHQDQRNSTDGETSSRPGLTSPRQSARKKRKLNPNFVDWLMDWMPGWTALRGFAPEEMELSRFRQHTQSAYLLHLLGRVAYVNSKDAKQ